MKCVSCNLIVHFSISKSPVEVYIELRDPVRTQIQAVLWPLGSLYELYGHCTGIQL